MPAAEGILTTDLYPKVRRAVVGEGSIVGFAKGAGMIEPNLATMLVFLLTDLDVSRAALRSALEVAVEGSFNRISVDTDTSTSDSVILLSSRRRPTPAPEAFQAALSRVCADLAEDVVRNGEGVHHVIRVAVAGAADERAARLVAKAVVNSPLLKAAVNGNDPNVGRLLCAVGKVAGAEGMALDPARTVMRVGGEIVLEGGAMRLDPGKEQRLVAHLRSAELYASAAPVNGVFRPPIDFPAHERCVEIGDRPGHGPRRRHRPGRRPDPRVRERERRLPELTAGRGRVRRAHPGPRPGRLPARAPRIPAPSRRHRPCKRCRHVHRCRAGGCGGRAGPRPRPLRAPGRFRRGARSGRGRTHARWCRGEDARPEGARRR